MSKAAETRREGGAMADIALRRSQASSIDRYEASSKRSAKRRARAIATSSGPLARHILQGESTGNRAHRRSLSSSIAVS